MSDRNADAFFERIVTALTRFAVELGLGTARGHFTDRIRGRTRTFAIFGAHLNLQLALVCEEREGLLALGQVRMRWYFWPAEAALDLGKLPGRPPLLETVRGVDDLEKRLRRVLGWLHERGGDAESVFSALGRPAVDASGHIAGVRTDPDNDPS